MNVYSDAMFEDFHAVIYLVQTLPSKMSNLGPKTCEHFIPGHLQNGQQEAKFELLCCNKLQKLKRTYICFYTFPVKEKERLAKWIRETIRGDWIISGI